MFDDIGLFDESFGMGSGEDYDLCIRASRGGYRIKGGSSTMLIHWWGRTKDNLPKGEGFTNNYDLIMAGNKRLTEKWGPHIDKSPDGWSVAGSGGPDEPLDQATADYKGKEWFQEIEL